MESTNFNVLICGNHVSTKTLEDLYNIINENIKSIINRINELIVDNEVTKTKIYLPFLLRNLLETTCIAILGRIDPFRLLCVQKHQLSDSYDIGAKNDSSINWNNDIIGESTSKDKIKDLWSKYDSKRALFCKKTEELYWKPAYKTLIDNDQFLELEYSEKYKNIDENSIVPYLKSKSRYLFSSLSKGVHSELLIDNVVKYDQSTLFDLLDETIEFCSFIAILVNQIDISFNTIENEEALGIYYKINNWRDSING